MRLYGKKNIRGLVDGRTKRKQEMRDAILWEIDGTSCRVKIQGSGTLVVAHFPQNQKEAPLWLRKGNAVRVVHKEGIRGYLEIIGEGRSIPTPQSGGTFPDIGGLSDGVMSGLIVTSTSPASNSVKVSSGTYRIGSVIYSMEEVSGGYLVMDDPAPMVMGILPFVLNGQVFYDLNNAPLAGKFRYDIIVIGVDGDLTLIEGAEVTSNPAMPNTPENTVRIVFILRVGGDSDIPMKRINRAYTTSFPSSLVLPSGLTFPWDFGTDFPLINFTVNIKNQYGQAESSDDGWILRLTKLIGTGDVWSLDSGYNSSEVTQDVISSSSYTFKYRRDQTEPVEVSPSFQVTLEGGRSKLYGFEKIILLDNGGNPI